MESTFNLGAGDPFTVETIEKILSGITKVTYDSAQSLSTIHNYSGNKISASDFSSLAIGIGPEVPSEIVKVMLLLQAEWLTASSMTLSPAVISKLLEQYQFDILPQVFTQGLVTSPVAHLLLPVFGSGKLYFQGYLLKAADVHDIFSWNAISWPEYFPDDFLSFPVLELSYLTFTFIQLKKVFAYSIKLHLEFKEVYGQSENFISGQIAAFDLQLNNALSQPLDQTAYLQSLSFQLEKLIASFSEYLVEVVTVDQVNLHSENFQITEFTMVNLENLRQLLQQLGLENINLHKENKTGSKDGVFENTHQLVQQPYALLKNLEKIIALLTIIKVVPYVQSSDLVLSPNNIWATYKNQVLTVVKESVFAEIIQKTVSFMYASVSTN